MAQRLYQAATSRKRPRGEDPSMFALDDMPSEEEVGTRFGAYFGSLRDAISCPPAVKPGGMIVAVRTIPWAGHGTGTVTCKFDPVNDPSRLEEVVRIAPQPWCSSPVVWLRGPLDSDVRVPDGGEPTRLVSANVVDDNMENIPSNTNTVSNLMSGEFSNPSAHAFKYMNVTPEHIGLGNTCAKNGSFKTVNQNDGKKFTTPDSGFPAFQYMGGFIDIEVNVPEGASCICTAVCPDETRQLGRTTLDDFSMRQMLTNQGAMYDFHQDERCYMLGGLEQIKVAKTIVGSANTQKHVFALPVPPSRMNLMEMNSEGQHSKFTFQPSFTANASAVNTMGASEDGLAQGGNDWVQLPSAEVDSSTNPLWRLGQEIYSGLNQLHGNSAYDMVHLGVRNRLARATNSIAQTLKDGMPQFECRAMSGAVTIQVSYKFFMHFVTAPDHPLWETARTMTGITAETVLPHLKIGGGFAGSGESSLEASRNAHVAQNSAHIATKKLVNRVVAGLIQPTNNKAMPVPTPGIQPHHEITSHHWYDSILAGVKSVGSSIANHMLNDPGKAMGVVSQGLKKVGLNSIGNAVETGAEYLPMVEEGAAMLL